MAKIYDVCEQCGQGYSFSSYDAEIEDALAECLNEAMRFLEFAARPEADPSDVYVPEEQWNKWQAALESVKTGDS